MEGGICGDRFMAVYSSFALLLLSVSYDHVTNKAVQLSIFQIYFISYQKYAIFMMTFI